MKLPGKTSRAHNLMRHTESQISQLSKFKTFVFPFVFVVYNFSKFVFKCRLLGRRHVEKKNTFVFIFFFLAEIAFCRQPRDNMTQLDRIKIKKRKKKPLYILLSYDVLK